MIKLYYFFWNKWIFGLCPHICLFCKHNKAHFKSECWAELTSKPLKKRR